MKAQTTSHVRPVRDTKNRCKYDDGPFGESIAAAAPFPGDK